MSTNLLNNKNVPGYSKIIIQLVLHSAELQTIRLYHHLGLQSDWSIVNPLTDNILSPFRTLFQFFVVSLQLKMGRLLAIDYGRKRCGIAVTDVLQIVATALDTVPSAELINFVKTYVAREQVDEIVVGLPKTLDGQPSDSMRYITPAINRLRKELPDMKITFFDERFTSTLAHRAMLDSGVKKSDRRDKGAIDRMAAVIILNGYLESRAMRL